MSASCLDVGQEFHFEDAEFIVSTRHRLIIEGQVIAYSLL